MVTEQKNPRLARCQRLREAEGLLELITLPASRLGLDRRLRRRLARRALRMVMQLSLIGAEACRRDLVIGQSLRLLGRYERAVGPLLAAVRRCPEAREGWIALGWCLKRMGRVDRAAGVLAQGIASIPDDAVLHFNFACYLSRLGQADMAVAELLWAFDLNPDLRSRLAGERDFDAIRGQPSFQALCQSVV